MDAAALAWGNTLLALSVLGTAWGWLAKRSTGFDWALLLWLPVPFYAYSVAYGSVPIFLPVWWPHSWYNTRYGMELLPALALGVGFVAQFVMAAVREFKPAGRLLRGGIAAGAGRAECWRRWCASIRWFMWKARRTRARGSLR